MTLFATDPLYRADPEREWPEPGRSGLLGRPVATSGESGPAKRLGHSFYPKFVPLLLSLLPSTVRLTRGRDIQAACGQLAAER